MATDVMPNTEPSMTKLIGGIIDDTQRLVLQQAELLKADIRKDFKEAKEVGQSMMIAGSLMGVGGLLLSFALVYLIKWAVPALHESACFGIVGGLFALAGGIAFYYGRERLEKLNPLPEQSAQAMKENLQWKTNPS